MPQFPARPEIQRLTARQLFTDGHSLRAVANTLAIPLATVRSWRQRGKWVRARVAPATAPALPVPAQPTATPSPPPVDPKPDRNQARLAAEQALWRRQAALAAAREEARHDRPFSLSEQAEICLLNQRLYPYRR